MESAVVQNGGSTIRAHQFAASGHYTARELVTLMFRQARLIMVVFFTIAALGVAGAATLKPLYPAETRVMVLPSRDYMMRQDVGLTSGPVIALDQNQVVRTEIEIMTSRTMIERVVDVVGPERLYPDVAFEDAMAKPSPIATFAAWARGLLGMAGTQEPPAENTLRGKIVSAFAKDLTVNPVKDANVITIVFSHRDRVIAAETANALVDAYLDHRRAVLAQPRTEVFSSKRQEYAERLRGVETQLEAFKAENNISSFPDQKSLLLRQHAEMASERIDTSTRLSEAEGRLVALRQTLRATPEQIELYSESSSQDSRDTARSTMVTLEMRRNELLTKFREDSRYVTDLDDQIAQLRRIISQTPPKQADTKRQGRNPVYDQVATSVATLEAEVASLRQRALSLTEKVEMLSVRLAEFDHAERRYNELVLQRQLLEDNLKTYSQKVEESTIMEELDRQKTANVRVVQYAQPPSDGRSLKALAALLSVVGGAVVALTLAFWIEMKREIMVTPEAAERALKLAVLLSVPYRADLGSSYGGR